MSVKKLSVLLGVLVVVSMVLTACPAPQPQVVEKIVTQVVEKEVKVVETQVVEKQVEVEKIVTQQVEVVKEVAAEDFTTPHPILSDIKVRQAIAHCINRDELIASVYPFLTDEQKAELRMDTNLPKTHWAYKRPVHRLSNTASRRVARCWTRPAGSWRKAPPTAPTRPATRWR